MLAVRGRGSPPPNEFARRESHLCVTSRSCLVELLLWALNKASSTIVPLSARPLLGLHSLCYGSAFPSLWQLQHAGSCA